MNFSRKDWVTSKVEIAKRLHQGECGGGYGEAILIICSAISAMAAEVWPGDRIDRKRFVEIVSTYGDLSQKFLWISIPLLYSSYQSIPALIVCSPPPGRIVTGDDTDKAEQEVSQLCPTLTLKEIRKYSYPNILYEQVRSGYVHEYQPGPQADSSKMTSREDAIVSYTNTIGTDRRIYFHLDALFDVATEIAESLDKIARQLPLSMPPKWWIDG